MGKTTSQLPGDGEAPASDDLITFVDVSASRSEQLTIAKLAESDAFTAATISVVDVDGNFVGTNLETVAQELAASIEALGDIPATFDPQAQPGLATVVQYMTVAVSGVGADGWYYPGDTTTVADLTSRVSPVEWHGIAAQKPADGSTATSFRIGDKFIKRPDAETL